MERNRDQRTEKLADAGLRDALGRRIGRAGDLQQAARAIDDVHRRRIRQRGDRGVGELPQDRQVVIGGREQRRHLCEHSEPRAIAEWIDPSALLGNALFLERCVGHALMHQDLAAQATANSLHGEDGELEHPPEHEL